MMRPVLLFCALLAALLAALAVTPLMTRLPPVREASEAGEFDTRRAKGRLAAILGDERPHPADTFANDAVRARLVGQIRSMGLNPIVRDQFACNALEKRRGVSCARVRNVLVALGPAGDKALLLNAHYDSNPAGPGAGDAGAGVATLLEVASILKSERLERPVLFLFNEGEELGLVGARAFLSDPLSSRVDSLVNLEARGTSGPVTMFETSLPNGPAVRAFARSVGRPYANSLATDFYRQLPNYTDVNSFSERGWATLNFAMIGNETRYHSAGDNLDALDPRSLQHMGDQALALARDLAGAPPSGGGTMIFTDIAGRALIVLPQWLGLGLVGILAVAMAAISIRRGGTWRGLAMFVLALTISAALVWIAVALVGLARDGSFWRGYPLVTHLAVYSTSLLSAVAALSLLGRRLETRQLRAAFWLGFLLLGAAVAFLAPGGIIYFLFPPLAAVAGMIGARWAPSTERTAAVAAAILLWLTMGEMLALLGELMNNGPFSALAPLAAILALPWLIEARDLLFTARIWRAVAVAGALAGLGWAAAAAAPAYSPDRQQRFTLSYVADPGGGEAWWAVDNDGADLPEAFGSGWSRRKLPHATAKSWVRGAPALPDVDAPSVEVIGRGRAPAGRAVMLRLRGGSSDRIMLIAPEDAQILGAGTAPDIRAIPRGAKKGRYVILCSGRSCDGAELTLVTSKEDPVGLLVAGFRYALPGVGKPLIDARPANARPQYSPDHSVALARLVI